MLLDPTRLPARVRIANLLAAVEKPADASWDDFLFSTTEGWEGVDSTVWRAARTVDVERYAGREDTIAIYVGDMDCSVFVCEFYPGMFHVDADVDYADFVRTVVSLAGEDADGLVLDPRVICLPR